MAEFDHLDSEYDANVAGSSYRQRNLLGLDQFEYWYSN